MMSVARHVRPFGGYADAGRARPSMARRAARSVVIRRRQGEPPDWMAWHAATACTRSRHPAVDWVLTAIKDKTVSGARTAKIVISGLMRLAARHGAVTINLVCEAARVEGTPRRKPQALTAEERQQWLAALKFSEPGQVWDLPDLSLMMLATGCRIGECLAIGWDEIDLEHATVDVRWRLVRRTGVGLLRLPSTKSGKGGERVIPLPSWAMTVLKRRRLAITSEVQAVFPDSLGGWRDPVQCPGRMVVGPR